MRFKAIVVFISFIIRLAIRRNFGEIIHDIAAKNEPNIKKSDLRKYEKLSIKRQKALLDIKFLTDCKNFNVCPKFLVFSIPYGNDDDHRAIRKRLLKSALQKRHKESVKFQNELSILEKNLIAALPGFDFLLLRRAVRRNVGQEMEKTSYVHRKKLKALTHNSVLPFNADETIQNLSSYELSAAEADLLKNGLSFAIPPKAVNALDIQATFEMVNRQVCKSLIDNSFSSTVTSQISSLADIYSRTYRPSNSALKKHGILKKLCKRSNIVVLKPDKGNSVVLFDRSDYVQRMLEIIGDSTKFELLPDDPTTKREESLQRLLLRIKKKGFFDESTYNKIYPRGSRPARIYGSPKMHKISGNAIPPFRPIVSSIGTFNHALARFLSDMLTPHIPGTHSTQDSFSFVNELQQAGICGSFLTSFDVESLFTNIPLNETIDLAVNYIIDNTPGIKISKRDLKKLFDFATSKTNFLFDGKMYDQVDGVCMGSPLGPTLANLFMSHNENLWLQNYSGKTPLFYKRYVDDIFLAFENKKQSDEFFDYLNCRHKNIRFTREDEVNHLLPFLDVKIQSTDDLVKTSVYRKPTFTGLLTCFSSFVPLPYKKGLVNTLLFRAKNICSCKESFDAEVAKITEILKKTHFPCTLSREELKNSCQNMLLMSPLVKTVQPV